MKPLNVSLASLLSCSIVLLGAPGAFAGQAPPDLPSPDEVQSDAPAPASVQPALKSAQTLEQLLAPIALYPDNLLGEILAAATYPAEVVQAERWMQDHAGLQGDDLAKQVDQQPWDASVKALTEFPKVLASMDKNLAWTSALGDAYLNQQQDVTNAVQTLRQRAQSAGNLKSNQQEAVTTQGQTIVVQPADPQVVYVPTYDPWIVYGGPIAVWPGWYPYSGLYIGGPGISFGVGFGVGLSGGFGWGWGGWGVNWHDHNVSYRHAPFVSRTTTFYNRARFNGASGGFGSRGGSTFHIGGSALHRSGSSSGTRGGAFSGYDHGAVTHTYSTRGETSMGGSRGGGDHGGDRGGRGGGGDRSGGGARGGGGDRGGDHDSGHR